VNSIQALFNSHTTSAARLAALRTADDITQWAVYRVEVHQAACDNAAHAHQPAPATVKVMTSAELYQDYVHWGESRAWTKGTASAHTYNAFTQQLRYRYGSNKAPGQDRPPLRTVINIGRERLAGWEIDWNYLRMELVKAKFMSAGTEDDDNDVLDMQGGGGDEEDLSIY
jgi:hypothetical protein